MKGFDGSSSSVDFRRAHPKGRLVAMTKARTGAANGRAGGKLSGGARARNTLRALPRVKIVGTIEKRPVGAERPARALESSPQSAGLAAAAAATAAMGAALGLTG